jgi:hypothetical protein
MQLLEEITFPKRVVKLTRAELDSLPEYSCSLPTGATIGKQWKRNANAHRKPVCFHLHPFDGTQEPSFLGENWWLGEYAKDPNTKFRRDGTPETVLINWSKIALE